ncbi:hypothetical protein HG530_000084 [Fusarium avenaceum]|nr:hypothetical protein HG530_000084 [Fusarium avenaceum]
MVVECQVHHLLVIFIKVHRIWVLVKQPIFIGQVVQCALDKRTFLDLSLGLGNLLVLLGKLCLVLIQRLVESLQLFLLFAHGVLYFILFFGLALRVSVGTNITIAQSSAEICKYFIFNSCDSIPKLFTCAGGTLELRGLLLVLGLELSKLPPLILQLALLASMLGGHSLKILNIGLLKASLALRFGSTTTSHQTCFVDNVAFQCHSFDGDSLFIADVFGDIKAIAYNGASACIGHSTLNSGVEVDGVNCQSSARKPFDSGVDSVDLDVVQRDEGHGRESLLFEILNAFDTDLLGINNDGVEVSSKCDDNSLIKLFLFRFAEVTDAAADTWEHAFQSSYHLFHSGLPVILATTIVGLPKFSGHIFELLLELSSLLVGSNAFGLQLVEFLLLGINLLRKIFGGSLRCRPALLNACEFRFNLLNACRNAVDFSFQVVDRDLVCLALPVKILKLSLIGTCSGHNLSTKSVKLPAILVADLTALLFHLFFVGILKDFTGLLHTFNVLLNLENNLGLIITIFSDLSNLGLKLLDILGRFVYLFLNGDETVLLILDISCLSLDLFVDTGHLATGGSLFLSSSIKPLLERFHVAT